MLEWKPPHVEWFIGGKLNISANCVDRHVATHRADKTALIWEGEPGDSRTLTYRELLREVQKFGNVLRALGVGKGDRVAIYLPLIPEAAVAMLGCARIGAIHSVVFGGFSPDSLRDRINDAKAKVLITADVGYRRGNVVPLKGNSDAALVGTDSIEHVIVVKRELSGKHRVKVAGLEAHKSARPTDVSMQSDRDLWWHDLMKDASDKCEPEVMDAEDVLYILYTSGTTGKPKGIVHTTGGYLVGVYATSRMVFDIKDADIPSGAPRCRMGDHLCICSRSAANGTCGCTKARWTGRRETGSDICQRHAVTILTRRRQRFALSEVATTAAKHDRRACACWDPSASRSTEADVVSRATSAGAARSSTTQAKTETGHCISPLPGITATNQEAPRRPCPATPADLLDSAAKRIEVGVRAAGADQAGRQCCARSGRRRATFKPISPVAGSSRSLLR